MSRPAAARHLYLHVPFCASRCGYCAFVVEVGRPDDHGRYVDALVREVAIESGAGRIGALDTVYLGGGTPTLVGPDLLRRLLDAVRPHLADGAEVSVEANPETVTPALCAALVDAGVTRLSMGVQSFRETQLRLLDRQASPDQCRRAVATAREAGVASVSVDLLFGVPGQGQADVASDLADVLALAPDHVSWYELELKPGSALAARGDLAIDDEASADHYELIVDGLEAAGYRWYETANFARPGHECRHNLAYWEARDHVGVGVGAVGTVGGERRRNRAGLDAYISAIVEGRRPPASVETLDPETRRREQWMLALRLDRPIELERLGPPDAPAEIDRLAGIGLLTVDGDAVRLTRRGRFLQNAVAGALVDFA